jgi:ATPases of the AAA+ class
MKKMFRQAIFLLFVILVIQRLSSFKVFRTPSKVLRLINTHTTKYLFCNITSYFSKCIVNLLPFFTLALSNKIVEGFDRLLSNAEREYNKRMYHTYVVDLKENPRIKFAFFEELKKQNAHLKANYFKIEDSACSLEYEIPEGTYTLKDKGLSMDLSLNKDTLVMKTRKTYNLQEFKDYIEEVYLKYNSPKQVVVYYLSRNGKWNVPIFRCPRDLSLMMLSEAMRELIKDVEEFKENKENYRKESQPYRRGYFLIGKPGSGKSLMVEYIAQKYGMQVHLVNLNVDKMTDSMLINLVACVPPNSLVCFDEIDKQMETLLLQKKINVSVGGILTAIDGPQRLSDGTIVIMTSNKKVFLKEDEMEALLRKGRIDKVFEL